MDGEAAIVDVYAQLRDSGSLSNDPRWLQPLSEVFNQQFVPSDVPSEKIIADFAKQNHFEVVREGLMRKLFYVCPLD